MHLISSRLGRIWFFGVTAGLARLGRPGGAETRRRPCTVRAGDGYKVGRCEREVLIALVSVLNIMPLAIIRAVTCAYSKWLKVGCLIGWPKLSGCIRGTCSSSSICILRGRAVFFRGRAVFLRGKAVVQSSKISALFAACIGSPVLGISSTVGWRYLSVSYAIYPHSATQL